MGSSLALPGPALLPGASADLIEALTGKPQRHSWTTIRTSARWGSRWCRALEVLRSAVSERPRENTPRERNSSFLRQMLVQSPEWRNSDSTASCRRRRSILRDLACDRRISKALLLRPRLAESSTSQSYYAILQALRRSIHSSLV